MSKAGEWLTIHQRFAESCIFYSWPGSLLRMRMCGGGCARELELGEAGGIVLEGSMVS
jgi:hypothetical protein